MSVARALAKLSDAADLKVGALLVNKGRVLLVGWNDETTDPVTHAEIAVLGRVGSFASAARSDELYVTTSPCLSCAKRIIEYGAIGRVYYQHEWWDKAATDLLTTSGIEVVRLDKGGVESHKTKPGTIDPMTGLEIDEVRLSAAAAYDFLDQLIVPKPKF